MGYFARTMCRKNDAYSGGRVASASSGWAKNVTLSGRFRGTEQREVRGVRMADGSSTRNRGDGRAAVSAVAVAPETRSTAGRPAPVRVERLILHELDNREARLRLVDEPAQLSEQTQAFFAGHIEAAAQRADWRAYFVDPEGEVPAMCRGLLGRDDDFVAASHRLAHRLYDHMRPRTIAPGDFVAAVYTVGGSSQRQVALLKLDPDQRLARTYTTSGGRTRVSIATAGNLLPDIARLQKCALVDPRPEAASDLTLLDTQAGPRADGVAAFFYRGFLAAELAPSPRRRTRDFLRVTEAWLATCRDELTPHELTRFYAARRQALQAEVLDVGLFAAAALPGHAEWAEVLRAQLAAALELADRDSEPVFVVDRAVASPVVGRITLELDGGARLSVPAERFAELVRIEPARTAEGKVRMVIESLTLKEVGDR
jgi:hypothetical protein